MCRWLWWHSYPAVRCFFFLAIFFYILYTEKIIPMRIPLPFSGLLQDGHSAWINNFCSKISQKRKNVYNAAHFIYCYLVRRKGQQTCCSFFTVHLLLANLLRPDSFHTDISMKGICTDSCSFFWVIICLRIKVSYCVEIVKKLRMAALDAPPLDFFKVRRSFARYVALHPGFSFPFFSCQSSTNGTRIHQRWLVHTKGNTRLQLVSFPLVCRNWFLMASIESWNVGLHDRVKSFSIGQIVSTW